METIILASASPRRQELLQQIGVPYEVVKSDAEEVLDAVEGPRALAVENARRKALTVAALSRPCRARRGYCCLSGRCGLWQAEGRRGCAKYAEKLCGPPP